MPSPPDPALHALALPFAEGALSMPESVLFLRARGGLPGETGPTAQVAFTQPFKPLHDALAMRDWQPLDEDSLPSHTWPLVLVLPPRQREEARALLARACRSATPGGMVVSAVANDEGAKSRQADLSRLLQLPRVASKHHCRVLWGVPSRTPEAQALADEWIAADAPRRIVDAGVPGGGFLSRPGVFAWDRVDAASRLLADHLPTGLHGRVADLGAGWGYLSMLLTERCPGIASLDLFEADARALALARVNLRDARVPTAFHWHDVAAGIPGSFDAIVCNPPFHAIQRGQRPDIGRAFIAAAAAALVPGGRLWLVANRHLPYEQALADGFAQLHTHAQQGGFKVIEAVRAR